VDCACRECLKCTCSCSVLIYVTWTLSERSSVWITQYIKYSVVNELSVFQRVWNPPGLLLSEYRGLLPLGSIGRDVNLITHLSLGPRVVSGVIPPLSHMLSQLARREQHCVGLEKTPQYFALPGLFNICYGVMKLYVHIVTEMCFLLSLSRVNTFFYCSSGKMCVFGRPLLFVEYTMIGITWPPFCSIISRSIRLAEKFVRYKMCFCKISVRKRSPSTWFQSS